MSSNISTSCRQKTVMETGRSWIMTILLAGAFILGGSSLSRAEEPTPDPMMLLNLDLFAAPAGNDRNRPAGQNAAPDADSMLDQIRALRAMGYLSPDGPLPDASDFDDPHGASTRAAGASPGVQQ